MYGKSSHQWPEWLTIEGNNKDNEGFVTSNKKVQKQLLSIKMINVHLCASIKNMKSSKGKKKIIGTYPIV